MSHLLDVNTGQKRTLPQAIYTLSSDGQTAVGTDFRRVNDMRPGYGYAGIPDPYQDQLAPVDSGIHCLNLDTGYHRTHKQAYKSLYTYTLLYLLCNLDK